MWTMKEAKTAKRLKTVTIRMISKNLNVSTNMLIITNAGVDINSFKYYFLAL